MARVRTRAKIPEGVRFAAAVHGADVGVRWRGSPPEERPSSRETGKSVRVPLPRLPAGCAGLLLAALAVAPGAAPRGGPAAALDPRPAIVAAHATGATATRPDGSWRTELAWLLPGDGDPAVAPDGRRLAFSSARTGNREIYVADTLTGDVERLTSSPRLDDRRPTWSPDGRHVAWESGRPAAGDLYVMRADGSHKRRLVGGASDEADPAWSPDGARVAFASNRAGGYDLWAAPSSGGGPELLLDVRGDARAPAWSPNGTRLAYSGADEGRTSIWVVDLSSPEPRRLTRSSGADLRPDWSPSGSGLAFTRAAHGRTRTWVVTASTGPARPLAGSDGDLDPDWVTTTPFLAPGPEELLPDLDQRAPSGLVVIAREGGFHLGFTSAVENLGRGPLRIRGWRPPGRATMRADQPIELRGGGTLLVPGVGTLRYEAHPPHRHWHFQEFETYELRRASDHELVGRDRKSGFCLVDRYGRAAARVAHVGPPRFLSSCGAGQPDLRRVEQGSSPGYVDRYPAFFHGQDIDVTRAPAGIYLLVHRANPTRRIREAIYSNDVASARIRLTWPAGRHAPPHVTVLRRCELSEWCNPR